MKKYDEFDEPRGSGLGFLGNVGPKAAFFIVLIALSFMIGVVWKLYVGGGSPPAGQEVPIVRADDNPFKVTPDDPGGMEIPHKDSTIFSSLNNEEGARVENLLADSDDEEPMPRSQLFAGLNTDDTTAVEDELGEGGERIVEMTAQAEEIVEEMIDDGVESVMPAPPEAIREGEVTDETTKVVTEMDALKETADTAISGIDMSIPEKVAPVLETAPEPVKVEVKPEPAPKPKPVVKAEPKPQPVAAPKPASVKAAAPAAGDYVVQVGSVRTRSGADSEWKKIQAKHSALSGFSHRVQAADLGAKGTFYRIQAGPVSKAAATAACNAIKRKDANGCLVKKK